jgi:hypothetical protein
MRGGGLGRFSSRSLLAFLDVVVVAEQQQWRLCVGTSFGLVGAGGKRFGGGAGHGGMERARSLPSNGNLIDPAWGRADWDGDELRGWWFPFPSLDGAIVRCRMAELIAGVISW